MQATTEQAQLPGPRRVASPVPTVASPTQSTPPSQALEVKFPPARDSFGVGIPSPFPPGSQPPFCFPT